MKTNLALRHVFGVATALAIGITVGGFVSMIIIMFFVL